MVPSRRLLELLRTSLPAQQPLHAGCPELHRTLQQAGVPFVSEEAQGDTAAGAGAPQCSHSDDSQFLEVMYMHMPASDLFSWSRSCRSYVHDCADGFYHPC
ncbi:uncharacterized protein [Aegilops tauschii subsp. strangulata]|uniref:uncharacterized protein isoform X2 n=1 Tax=Aegilops tauschii subsp. strangulata TaxID=200361 RepID=UPI003CC87E2D